MKSELPSDDELIELAGQTDHDIDAWVAGFRAGYAHATTRVKATKRGLTRVKTPNRDPARLEVYRREAAHYAPDGEFNPLRLGA